MPTSIPKPPTLNIQVNDSMNLNGIEYKVTNVGAGVDNGLGAINYAVTLNDPDTTVVTVNASNCVIHNPGVELTGSNVKQSWRQSVYT